MALALVVGACAAPEPGTPPDRTTSPLNSGRIALPLLFERNDGQAPADVDFVARVGGYTLLLEDASARLILHGEDGAGHAVRLRCVDGDAAARAEALEPNRARVNYLIGDDPEDWQADVATFDRVAYRDVYPGIDLVFRGNDARLEFDVEVAPGADPGAITLAIDGSDDLRLDEDGNLVASTPAGELRQLAPRCFQEIDGRRVHVEGDFSLRGDGTIGFALGEYDTDHGLTIDPVIEYATYFGGNHTESAIVGLAVDAAGAAYFASATRSLDFPDSASIPGFVHGAGDDAYVGKLNRDGTLAWSVVLGGAGQDIATDVAVGPDGDVYVAGLTFSSNLPTTTGALQTVHGGGFDAFVLRLAPQGDQVRYLTFLGGSDWDQGFGIAVGADGDAYVVGLTASPDFPTASAERSYVVNHDGFLWDAFVARISADGAQLPFATLLGGFGGTQVSTESARRIAVDASGLVTVPVLSLFHVGPPPPDPWNDPTVFEPARAFLMRLDTESAGPGALVAQTSLTGDGDVFVISVTLDPDGRAYVCGYSNATDLATAGAAQTQPGGAFDGFVAATDAGLTGIDWCTYFGAGGSEILFDVAHDEARGLHVVGYTTSLPSTLPLAFDDLGFAGGPAPAFVASLRDDGSAFTSLGVLGGTALSLLSAIEFDGETAWASGLVTSGGMPTTPNALFPSYLGGGGDGILVRIGGLVVPVISLVTDGEPFHACDTSFDWTAGKQMRFDVVVTGSATPAVATALPAGAVYDTGVDPATFTWTPTDLDAGTHTIAFEAGPTTCTLDVTVVFDTDGDALPDLWETDGYTYEDGTLVTLSDLSAYTDRADFVELVAGADPDHRDVFVWVDWMAAPGDASHASHYPDATALDLALQSFASGPSQGNPDGLPGVRLHLLVAQQPVAHQDLLGTGDIATFDWTAFDATSTMPPELRWSFHRALFAHDISTASHSGVSREPGIGKASSDFIVSLGSFTDGVGSLSQQAGTFQHELGHNLGLGHGGGDDLLWKPNYLSVMNYLFQMTGLRFEESYGVFDYSFAALPTLLESDLDEVDGLTGPGGVLLDTRWDGYGARWWYPFKPVDAPPPGSSTEESNYLRECGEVNQPIDWNWSDQPAKGQTPAGNVKAADADADVVLHLSQNSRAQVLGGFDDWTNLVFTGGRVGGGISVPLPQVTPLEELTVEQARLIAPAPPGSLRVVAADVQAVLTWKPLGPRKEWNYRVWRAVGEGDPVAIATTQNSEYQDSDAPTGVELTYSITAIDALGVESRASQGVTVTLP